MWELCNEAGRGNRRSKEEVRTSKRLVMLSGKAAWSGSWRERPSEVRGRESPNAVVSEGMRALSARCPAEVAMRLGDRLRACSCVNRSDAGSHQLLRCFAGKLDGI